MKWTPVWKICPMPGTTILGWNGTSWVTIPKVIDVISSGSVNSVIIRLEYGSIVEITHWTELTRPEN